MGVRQFVWGEDNIMDASFSIDPDPRLNLMRVRMTGFFSPADVQSFSAAYRAGLMTLRPNQLTIVDITEMKIQAQDIVGAFAGLMATPEIRSRKLAFVCGSTLARLQAQRLTDRPGVEFFRTVEDAEAWLFA